MTGLSDSFQRPINYLRISVTDRCNLRCVYCMPPEGVSLAPREDILHYEEIIAIVQAAAELGITKVRLTGGEPLARLGLVNLIKGIAAIPGIDDLSLTTNGILLAKNAEALKEAGLKRINLSLDTLKPERFAQITRGGRLKDVLRGMEAAKKCGLSPIKINTVVIRGVNDGEIIEFARKTLTEEWHVRFIELMPFGEDHESYVKIEDLPASFMPVSEMRSLIEALGPLEPATHEVGNGPARYFRLPNAAGTVGFISPVSEHFCFGCNRMRLTADGKLRPCLLSDEEVDLRTPLRRGASAEELRQLITDTVKAKPERHHLAEGITPTGRRMAQIGG